MACKHVGISVKTLDRVINGGECMYRRGDWLLLYTDRIIKHPSKVINGRNNMAVIRGR